MERYRIEIKRTAGREIEAVGQKRDRRSIVDAILSLGAEPRPVACRKLSGSEDVYRLRIRAYRVVYRVVDEERLVQVIKVGHRKEIYR